MRRLSMTGRGSGGLTMRGVVVGNPSYETWERVDRTDARESLVQL